MCHGSPEEGDGQRRASRSLGSESSTDLLFSQGLGTGLCRRVMPMPSPSWNTVNVASALDGFPGREGTWAFQGELIQRPSEKREMETQVGMRPEHDGPFAAGKAFTLILQVAKGGANPSSSEMHLQN